MHWKQDTKERKTASAARKLDSIKNGIMPVKGSDEIKLFLAPGRG